MSFTLDVPNVEEVKEAVQEELAVKSEEQLALENAAKEKAAEIMAVNLDSFPSRKEFTSAIESFGTDISQRRKTIF